MIQSPSMMKKIATYDGLQLQWRQWPAGDVAYGTVLIVHGLGEHIGRYARLVQVLNYCGWHVMGYTQRGHGVSEGDRGAIAHDDSLLRDLSKVLSLTRKARAARVVLLGHSMGGAVAARFVAEGLKPVPAPWWQPVEGLVLSSPALDAGLSWHKRWALPWVARLAPEARLSNGLKPNWISRDRNIVRAYYDDRLVHDRVTPRLANFIVNAGRTARELAPQWQVPTLLMWAGADKCVGPRGSEVFADRAPAHVVQSKGYPRLYHEIFNEPERNDVFDTLRQWLDRQRMATPLAAAPAAVPAPAVLA
jgi:alpha-beta hydrolase superfamily lysophospholipase